MIFEKSWVGKKKMMDEIKFNQIEEVVHVFFFLVKDRGFTEA